MYDKGILSEKVAKDIQQMIKDEGLQPGDKLPNELEMMSIINVGRSTIREAIKILVAAGMLEVKRGRGTFVGMNPGVGKDPLGVKFIDDENMLLHFYEMRLILEPAVARLAVERGTEEDFEKIKKAFGKVHDKIRNGGDHSEEDIHFHNAIAEATHNPIMERVIPIVNQGILEGYSKTKDNPYVAQDVLEQHEAVMEAIEERDGTRASAAMKRHIEYGMSRCKGML